MKKLIWPALCSLVGFSVYFALKWVDIVPLGDPGKTYLLAFCSFLLGMTVIRLCGFLLFDVIYRRRTRRDPPGLLRVLFSIFAYILLLGFVMKIILQYDISGLFATSAVLSLVIGFALRDTLGNFFAGASLHIEQNFRIKDSLKFRDKAGEIVKASWRTTTVRTNNQTFLVYPNGLLAREPMEIFPYNRLHRHSVTFPAPYSASPQTVMHVVNSAARNIPRVSEEIAPRTRIVGFGDSSVDYEVLYWVKDYKDVNDISAQIRERIWYAFYRDHISMPFPVRHVLFERHKTESQEKAPAIDYRTVVDKMEIFEPLNSSQREELVCSDAIRVYAPGECMVRCGENGDSMFIIGRGAAEVRMPSDGETLPVAVLETGSFFGEMSLFSGEPRTADVVALGEVEVLEIRKSCIQKLLDENSKLAEAFSMRVTERHAGLQNHADSVHKAEIAQHQERLLHRIKRFFNLG